uniref:Diacylglycerol O-acyltransferase n=1 Tax=Aegilops tauschii subsp. strangulata TaxID=200361 RepID=A0A452Y6K6_AEGTS
LCSQPVHKWIVRHIYFPCMRSGISKVNCKMLNCYAGHALYIVCVWSFVLFFLQEVAVFVSFFVSAVLHELVVAVPCRILKFWAFLGIMLQIPLITLTSCLKSKFRDTMAGNMIFWFFFCIYGQPMCVLLYYHDVMNRIGKTE